jgi:hypothetical protein
LIVPSPQLVGARATSPAIWSFTALTISSAGADEIAVMVSAPNELLISRPVTPARASTSCCSAKAVIS